MQNPVTAMIAYIRSSIAELKKVTWPTKDQTLRYSALVIAISVAVAAFFASLDLGFSRGILFALSKTSHSSAEAPAEPVTPDLEEMPEVQATTEGDNAQGVTVTPESVNAAELESTPTETPEISLPGSNDIQLPQ